MQLEDIKLGIVGLGYVGLPLCVEFAKEMPVIAYDINPERVNELLNGVDNTLEVKSEDIINQTNLEFSNEIIIFV